jgi:parvulin-like peptidyl-prolyl isomerase
MSGTMRFFNNIAAILFVLILACGQSEKKLEDPRYSDARAVARVGEHTLTLGEINLKFKDEKFENARQEYEAKEEYVNLAVERFLHIDSAKAAGLSCPMDSSTIQGYMFQELYKRDAKVNSEVSDSDVRRFFDHYGGDIQYGLIIVADSLLMDSIYQSLQRGGDWDSLVFLHSQLEIGKKRGGSLGYVPFWQYDDQFQLRAYDLEIGEYSEPFRFRSGWCMVKLFDRIKNSDEDLEQGWDRYKELTSRYSEYLQTEDYKRKLMDEYHYTVNWETIDTLIYIADSVKNSGSLPNDMPSSSYLERSAFTPEMLPMPVVSFDGGGIPAKEYLDLMDTYDPYRTPDLRDRYFMGLTLYDIAVKRIMADRALEMRVDTLRSFQEGLKTYEENWLIQAFNKKLYSEIDTLTDADIQGYYDNHPDEFVRPEQIRVSAIALKTREEALQILEKLNMGASFTALAQKYSLDKKSAAEGGDLNFFTVKRYTELYNAAVNMGIGEIGGPVEMYGNFWVFSLTQKLTEEPQPLHLVRSNIISKLYKDRREETIISWVEQNRKNAQYFLDLDLLREDLGVAAEDSGEVAAEEVDE